MKKKKVYRGWIDPEEDIFKTERWTDIVLWRLKESRRDRHCTITVEWTEPKRAKP